MPLSRRTFLTALGAGAAVGLAARGAEARLIGRLGPLDLEEAAPDTPGLIRLDSNENPHGPGAKVLEAFKAGFPEANRYPDAGEQRLLAALARHLQVRAEHLLLGCGSAEVLRACVQAFTSPTAALVTAAPSFEYPAVLARLAGHPVKAVPVDKGLSLDLEAMAKAAEGAGLVFLCNPNNPTATVHGRQAVADFVARLGKTSPKTVILVDEAYHDYVEDPGYRTAIPLALANPQVLVSRTFSKAYGLAGMRIGYAVGRPETLARLERLFLPSGVSQVALHGAVAALEDAAHLAEQQRLNREAKAFTRAWFEKAGHPVGPSEANFLMVDLRRDVKAFKAACLKEGVAVGRPFPPLGTHLRLSIGTRAEMEAAVAVLGRLLG